MGAVFHNILSSMLKGIAPQLKAISSYLQGQAGSEPAWEAYLINVQNNTLDLLKLTSMVLTELQSHLPRDLPSAFDRTVTALRAYLHNRPHGEPEEERGAWEEDEVSRFLENKPQIDTKDEERGELFKFLAMNEQKERNTQMMLQFAPRYSVNHPLPHLPLLPRNSCFRNERPQRPSEVQPGETRESQFGRTLTHGTSSREAERTGEGKRDVQTQTEPSLLNCMQNITFQGLSADCKQSLDIATEMNDFTHIVDGPEEQAHKQGGQSTAQAIVQNQPVGKNGRGQKLKNAQITIFQPNITQNQQKCKKIEGKGGRSSLAESNKLISKQEEKSKPKPKKNEEKRQSNSLSSSKKDLLKGVARKQPRKSKEVKEVKEVNEVKEAKDASGRVAKGSKFGKENKGLPAFDAFETIKETPQDLAASAEYCPTPEYGESYACGDREEGIVQAEGTAQTIIKEQGHSLQKQNDEGQAGERDKSSSDKQQINSFGGMIEQAFSSTANMPFYRNQSKAQEKHSSLPKIEQRSKAANDRAESLRKRIYDSSPYLSTSLHHGTKQPKGNSNSGMTSSSMSCNQHAHRSLHLNPSSGQSEREGLLREEETRMVREIQALGVRPAQQQWSRILRGIRHYQLMHATLCGEHCVHLSKFYEFLRRRNLAGCLNRRLLLPHKKNIEISTTL